MGLLDDMFDKEAGFGLGGVSVTRHLLPAIAASAGVDALRGDPAPSRAQVESDAMRSMIDPGHDAEMHRITMQAMLAEFLANDPVISTYDPEQVIEAFNQVTQLTPRASLQPAVMRGQLRKMLQQQDAMEPFEAAQLVDIEKGLQKLEEPAKAPVMDYPDIGLAPGSNQNQNQNNNRNNQGGNTGGGNP